MSDENRSVYLVMEWLDKSNSQVLAAFTEYHLARRYAIEAVMPRKTGRIEIQKFYRDTIEVRISESEIIDKFDA